MKIAPVLLAPRPSVPTPSSRRMFLMSASTFVLGTCFGGACGYAMGAQATGIPAGASTAEEEEEEEGELKPSGDIELDELRRLAVKAPLEELAERRAVFTLAVGQDYRRDEILWRGIDRLCAAVLSDPAYPNRTLSAASLAQVIELADPEFRTPRTSRVAELRKLR